MEFLGMIIGQGQIAMDPVKLTTIRDWKPPASVKGIRSFLGFANFYRKFIPNFSHVVTPLNLLEKTNLGTGPHFNRGLSTPSALPFPLDLFLASLTLRAPFPS